MFEQAVAAVAAAAVVVAAAAAVKAALEEVHPSDSITTAVPLWEPSPIVILLLDPAVQAVQAVQAVMVVVDLMAKLEGVVSHVARILLFVLIFPSLVVQVALVVREPAVVTAAKAVKALMAFPMQLQE